MSRPEDFCIGCINDIYPESLTKENAELKARLDKWESQEPVAWMSLDAMWVWTRERDINPTNRNVIPLFTKPKEEV